MEEALKDETAAAAPFAWIEAAGGPRVTWADQHHHSLAGLDGWWAHGNEQYSQATRKFESLPESKPRGVHRHIETATGTLMLTVSPPDEDGSIRWRSSLALGENRYIRSGNGKAASFPEAQAAAESYVHPSREVGGLTWWADGVDHWKTWVGPLEIEARKVAYNQAHPWEFEVTGQATTFEEAAILATLGRIAR